MTCEMIKKEADPALGLFGCRADAQCCIGSVVNVILSLALLIIGCQSANFASSSHLGWTVIGLAGVSFVSRLGIGNLKERKAEIFFNAFVTAVYVTGGALGITGILTINQLGWLVVGAWWVGSIGNGVHKFKILSDTFL